MSKKSRFSRPSENQHGRWAETLFESEPSHKYFLLTRDKLTQPIQVQLFQKQKKIF